jgi:predicted protein tyrosine phosphatase
VSAKWTVRARQAEMVAHCPAGIGRTEEAASL